MRLWHQFQTQSLHALKSRLTKHTKVREGDAAPGPGSGGKWGSVLKWQIGEFTVLLE